MYRLQLLTILSFLFFQLNAQQVTTLVSGPDGFNDGLVLDDSGNIYASYYFGTVVTKITPDGTTSTFASGFRDPNGLTFTPDGELLVPEATANIITLVDSAGNKSFYDSIANPSGLVFLPDGSLLVAQYTPDKVSIIDTAGNISDYMTGTQFNGGPVGIAYDDSTGDVFVSMFDTGKIVKRDTSGTITEIADLVGSCGFITEGGDYVYATALTINRIYRIAKDGSTVEVIAGTGARGQIDGPGFQATFNAPNGIVATKTGDTLYVSDYNPRSLRMITGVNSITGIAETNLDDHAVSVWPMPVQDHINVSALREFDELSWKVWSMDGVLVGQGSEYQMNNDFTTIHLNLEFNTGLYLLEILTDNNRVFEKIQIE